MDIAAASFPALFVAATAHVANALLLTLFWVLLIGVLLSWIPMDNGNPVVPLIYQISEPLLAPFRRLLPNMPIDLSPIFAIMVVQLARILVVAPLSDYAQRLASG
jgi:YggT family protein